MSAQYTIIPGQIGWSDKGTTLLKATVAALRDGEPLKVFNLAISTTFAPGELKLLNPIDPEFTEYIEGLESIANKFEGKINIFNQGKEKLKLYKEVRKVQNHYYQTINSRTTMIEMVKNTIGNISKKQQI